MRRGLAPVSWARRQPATIFRPTPKPHQRKPPHGGRFRTTLGKASSPNACRVSHIAADAFFVLALSRSPSAETTERLSLGSRCSDTPSLVHVGGATLPTTTAQPKQTVLARGKPAVTCSSTCRCQPKFETSRSRRFSCARQSAVVSGDLMPTRCSSRTSPKAWDSSTRLSRATAQTGHAHITACCA